MEPLIKGGSGRTSEQVYNDGVNICWAILLGIVLIASCIGCAPRRSFTSPREEPKAEIISDEDMALIERGRAEREEMERSGKSLKRLTGN